MRFFDSQHGTSISSDAVHDLIEILNQSNELVKLMRTARDLCLERNVPDFAIRLYSERRHSSYDTPTAGTLGAIILDDAPLNTNFDIIVTSKDGSPKRISKLHPLYMPLQYPLLFPFAEQGWSPNLRLRSESSSRPRKMTMNIFYSYQIHDRVGLYTLLLNGGLLFQQYQVDAYVCIEMNRLEYIQQNQNLLCSEFLHEIHDAIAWGETNSKEVGKRILLPSSFTGSPRYMYKHYQDALAICRVHGNPQYFITFTCNVKWPEIRNYNLNLSHQLDGAQDRPDIIARVFQLKVESFIKYLKTEKPFGNVTAELYTIEFQKRGLPHCHTLLWVTAPYKIHAPADVDRFISAELPDKDLDPHLYKIVTESMMHGPCGLLKPNSPCMIDGVCSKHFPKPYDQMTRFDEHGYIHYKRNSHATPFVKNGIPLDNAYVVPYNKSLCMPFDAHINVEYCGWSMLIKYLFKYISKGVDRIRFAITTPSVSAQQINNRHNEIVDEVKNYIDGRYVCPHEAAWRILNFHIHYRNPTVQVLAVHLEDMQNIKFQENRHLQNVLRNPGASKTTLTEWLRNNVTDASGRHLRYIDYLLEYRWDVTGRCWIRRVSKRNPAIGRLIYIHPAWGEVFYMRLLLAHQIGCTSFESIRTVGQNVYNTYRDACQKLGILGDDLEWDSAFVEAAAWATAAELRTLFTHILLFCDVCNPTEFWTKHWRLMGDDITLDIRRILHVTTTFFNDNDLQQYILYEIELLLNSGASSCSLSNFGLPMPSAKLLLNLRNKLLMEEKNYNRVELANKYNDTLHNLNCEQKNIWELVMSSCTTNTQILLFVYGHGGTGKTYLWNTIILALRSSGKIVLAVAGSGIASLLLPSGRTAHSWFKIPLEITDDSLCFIKKNTQLAELLSETSLIIWDEAPMSDKRCFESLDKTLKDI